MTQLWRLDTSQPRKASLVQPCSFESVLKKGLSDIAGDLAPLQCAVPEAIAQCRHDWMRSALEKWAASLVVEGGVGGDHAGGGGVSHLLVCPSA